MEIIKKTREVGKSSGVLLPRSWLNKQVVVKLLTPDTDTISKEIIEILIKSQLLQGTIGIYLIGSYARHEEDENSDIDILVITSSTNKLLKYGNCEINLIKKTDIQKGLTKDLHIISILKEALPLLNKEYLEELKQQINLKKFNLSFLQEIKRVLKLNELVIAGEDTVNSGVIYSIILRLRELYILDCIFHNKAHSKKEFISLIGDKGIYQIYEDIKNDLHNEKRTTSEEAIKILNKARTMLKKWEKKRG